MIKLHFMIYLNINSKNIKHSLSINRFKYYKTVKKHLVKFNPDLKYIMVKYIQKSDKGDDDIKLDSKNKHHQDKNIHLALVIIKTYIY